MASVCFYFQVHQPWRLRRYSVFDTDPFYFDNDLGQLSGQSYGPPRTWGATLRLAF